MAAAFFKAPSFAIDTDESKKLAEAVANVQRHYDMRVTQKQMDISNLVIVLCMIYGTRIGAVLNEKKKARGAQDGSNVAKRTMTVIDPTLPGGKAEVEIKS